MNELAQDWAGVTQIDAGKCDRQEYAVMLRFALRVPPGVQLLQPASATPALYLTERQARDLLLLIAHALGFDGTGFESKPPKPAH